MCKVTKIIANWAVREQVIRAVNALHAKEDVGIAALSLGENKDQAETVMDVLELCARDIMVMQDSDGDVIQTDIQHMLPVDRFSGAGMLQAVMEARRRLSSNVSWQSVAEMLFFEMLDKKRF